MGKLLMYTYKEEITRTMTELAKEPDVLFIGQGLSVGDQVYETMRGVPSNKCIEFPTAENLMVGAAIGLSLKGLRPIIVFQRMDFMLVCADAIINHLALLPKMSNNTIKLPIMIRAVVGAQDTKKFDVGLQHTKDLGYVFSPYIQTISFKGARNNIFDCYMNEYNKPHTSGCLFVEYKDLYGVELKTAHSSLETSDAQANHRATTTFAPPQPSDVVPPSSALEA